MQTKAILVCLLLPLVCGQWPLPPFALDSPSSTVSPQAGNVSAVRSDSRLRGLQALFDKGQALRLAGRCLEAGEVYLETYRQAKAQGEFRLALRSLSNAGICWDETLQYGRAIGAYLEARSLAKAIGDREDAGVIAVNLSTVYFEMGEMNGAEQTVKQGLDDLHAAEQTAKPGLDDIKQFPQRECRAGLMQQMVKVYARRGDLSAAVPLAHQAIDEADRQGDTALQALGWHILGYELLRNGRLETAEHALFQAFRLGKLGRDPDLGRTYLTLAVLRLAQGDSKSASRLIAPAVAAARLNPDDSLTWDTFYVRGKVRMAQGKIPQAVADFRRMLGFLRRLRMDAGPADVTRVSMDADLDQPYSTFIQAAARLYFATGRPSLAREAFEVCEENRAASLRALFMDARNRQSALPPQYGEELGRLRAAEASLARDRSERARLEIGRLRNNLTEMEAKAGLDFEWRYQQGPGVDGLLERVRRTLSKDEALLSFHLARPESYLWAVTHEGFEMRRLAGAAEIAAAARRFAEEVKNGTPAAARSGRELYGRLFGSLSRRVLAKQHWLMALDGELFELPFAALVVDENAGRPTFLIERHSLEIVPSAHLLAAAPQVRSWRSRRFIGIGDAVYNTADPRWHGPRDSRPMRLPRLVASAREIHSCAQAWGPDALLLEGTAVSRTAVACALQREPAVLHFATHIIPSGQAPGQGLIALGLEPGGAPDFLDAFEIATWRVNLGLVVLSGCSSGVADALPGAGLMGLTRSWLAAGAQAVAASLWPTPDDTGELFRSFYRHLRESAEQAESGIGRGLAPAKALERAQLDMLRSGAWRSLPKYWAAYFLVGKE